MTTPSERTCAAGVEWCEPLALPADATEQDWYEAIFALGEQEMHWLLQPED